MKELPLNKAFMLLEPGPVILVTTNNKDRYNIMTISWHMVLDFTPQFAILTGPWNYSYEALTKTKECVISVPTADISQKVVEIGACTGMDTDKFKKFSLTPLKAQSVKAPLVKECLANIECRVTDYVEKHNIFILDAVMAWIDPDRKERRTIHAIGDGTFIVDGRTINYRKLMLSKIPDGV
ncbi:MAG: flavin reductase family protein [Bacteroidales bacterium]|jgi:flavin reductase (DIM6/NTAB) family NADH-FMN oxidoreductase RutF